MGPVFLFVVKPPPLVVDLERFTRIVVHFLLVQKTNQKRTPVPFDPPGSLCSSGVAENPRFEEQILFTGNTLRYFGKRQWAEIL